MWRGRPSSGLVSYLRFFFSWKERERERKERTERERKKGSIFGSWSTEARLNDPRGLRSKFSTISAYSACSKIVSLPKTEKVDFIYLFYLTLPKGSEEEQGSLSF